MCMCAMAVRGGISRWAKHCVVFAGYEVLLLLDFLIGILLLLPASLRNFPDYVL